MRHVCMVVAMSDEEYSTVDCRTENYDGPDGHRHETEGCDAKRAKSGDAVLQPA